MGSLFGGKKKSSPKPVAAAPEPAAPKNLGGVISGAGAESSNVLSNGNAARSTFLGG